MAKISRSEFLDNIRNIINEGMDNDYSDFDGTEKFGIRRYVTGLVEEGYKDPKLMSFLVRFDHRLNEGEKEFMLFEEFGQGLSKFAKANKAVKSVITQMNETLKESGNELEGYMLIENIQEPYAQKVVKDAYNTYIAEKNYDSKANLVEALDVLYQTNDRLAERLNVLITEDAVHSLPAFSTFVNESEYDSVSKKIERANEEKKIKKIQEQIEAYANQIFDNAIQEREEEKAKLNLANIANSNGIGLTEAIKTIANSNARDNAGLMQKIDEYAGALTHGAYEERLYETFITNMQKYNYLLPVERAIKMIKENVEKRNLPIMITKILEEMSESMSYYIVPLIEEDCARFVKEPTPTNRVQMRNALVPHAGDPYVYAMLEAIDRDDTKAFNSLSEKALSIKDQIKMIRQNTTMSEIYSPIQYIKENECVFNANGQFYVKKGNNLAKLDEQYIPQLSEKFIALCQLVNDPRVSIDEDKIIFASNDKVAYIYEGYVDINGCRESRETLRNLNEMCMKYDFDTDFYITCSCLHENFNNIAHVNFAKHVSLNENSNINLDLFRLGNNIFINTVNEAVAQSTFYRDVNPIQCKNIINNHMGIGVASLFEDLVPSQDKIILRLNETQNEYESAISKYEATIEKLEKALESCSTDENKEKLENAIKTAKDKVTELKKEYKEWQKDVENETQGKSDEEKAKDKVDKEEVSGDGEPRKETTNEPLKDEDEVEAAMDDLTTPISDELEDEGEAETTDDFEEEESTEGMNITDDEFKSFLKGGEDEEDATEDDYAIDADTEIKTTDLGDEDAETETEYPETEEGTFDFNTAAEEFSSEDTEGDEVGDECVGEECPEKGADEESETVEPGDEATDAFGGDLKDPLEMNKEVSIDNITNQEDNVDAYKIANVLFDENIKTGEKYKSGVVSVIVPMVQRNGKMYIKNESYHFYLDEDGMPILDNDEMTAELYNAIVAAIKANPHYDEFVKEGIEKADEVDNIVNSWVVNDGDDEDDDDEDDDFKDSIFDVQDDEDELTFKFNDDHEEENVPETPEKINTPGTPVVNPKETPVIPTYKSGDTEIELPAPTADGTAIPENKEVKVKKNKKLNENKKSVIKIRPEYKKGDKYFFLNEGAIKPSKKQGKGNAALNEEIIGGSIDNEDSDLNEPIVFSEEVSSLEYLHKEAIEQVSKLEEQGVFLKVTNIETYGEDVDEVEYFTIEVQDIEQPSDDTLSYTIYKIMNDVYYRPSDEFYQILKDFEDEVPGQTIESLKVDYLKDEPLDSVQIFDTEECEFIITSIIQSLTDIDTIDESMEMLESCKIRRPKLSAGGDFEKSKLVDDVLHGDKEKRDFEEKVEKDTQKAGIDNPIAPVAQPEQEAHNPKLPNAHLISEQYDITYEPMDKVIYKKEKAQVISVSEDGEKINILIKDGKTIEVKPKDLEPDPEYMNDLSNTPEQFDFDKNNLTKSAQNEDPVKMKDLNGNKSVRCNIVVDGHRINVDECRAAINDIIDFKGTIRVLSETGEVQDYNRENIAFTERPYAVIVDNDGKPVRTIKVDPDSYIEANENDLVYCEVGQKLTRFPKDRIKILS